MILLLSFLMVPIFNFLMAQHTQEKRFENKEDHERILAAIAIFVKNNGRYPCPSKHTLKFGDANFGREDCTFPSSSMLQGDIPIYALGLPYKLMINSHGFRYLYAVTQDQTVAATYNGAGDIIIIDEFNNTILNNVPFVLVDLGHDAKGTVKLNNGMIKSTSCDPPPGGPAYRPSDSENCDNDDTYRDMPYSEKSTPYLTGYYDDVIFYDLARDESTLWVTKKNSSAGGVEITNRNTGNIGIGTYSAGALPSDKLEVTGGNVKVDTGNVRVGGKVQANTFCYDASGC